VGVALAALIASTGVAAAQPSPERLEEAARIHFDLGRAQYAAGRFEEAVVEFREAYRLSGRPELLFNIHLAERDAGNLLEARDALRDFLASDAAIEGRTNLEARLAALDRQLAAGRTTVSPTSTGDRDGPPAIGWVLTVGGAALLVGATVTGVLALSTDADLSDRCPGGVCGDPADMDDIDRGQTLALLTDVLGGTGLIALAIGVTVLLIGGGEREEVVAARGGGLRWVF
jgi:tetratricopeptide (TPR) repeat protein